MGDMAQEPNESFRREMELLKAMIPTNEDTEEIDEHLKNLNLREDESDKVLNGPLTEAFYAVNCPFVWSEYVSNENMQTCISSMEGKVESRDNDWKIFCFRLYFAFLYARLGKLTLAFKELEFCEEYVRENREDEFYQEIVNGLDHCIEASRAHLHFLKGDTKVADDIISKVFPVKELNNPSKAALIAVNAEVMQEFNLRCKEMALKMMQVAVKLDPDDKGSRRGAWYYSIGKLLGQMRRSEHRAGMPSREELKMLERATKINPFPVSIAALADSYREASTSAIFGGKMQVSHELCSKMLIEARQLYKRAFELDNENSSTLRRCGNGLMKLPAPHKDLSLAKQCLEKAISVNPKSSSAYQALGTMEEKYFKNLNGALKYFQLSYEHGNPISGAFIVEVRMRIERGHYNPIADLDKFIAEMQGHRVDMKSEFLILKGEYLFFFQNDLLAAAKFWKEAILLAPKSENVMNHVCRFVHGRRFDKPYLKSIPGRSAFNLYDCLKYEIGNVLESSKYTNSDKELLKELLELSKVNGGK